MVASSLDALDEYNDETNDRRPYARTENLSALCVNLAKLFEGRGKFVLVLDAVDKLRETAGTLIAALGRLGESVCNRSKAVYGTLLTYCRFPIYPSSSRRPYLYHHRRYTLQIRPRYTSRPTTEPSSCLYWDTARPRSSSPHRPKNNSQTTRPISLQRTTTGCGVAS
jgi:hypothetical protein